MKLNAPIIARSWQARYPLKTVLYHHVSFVWRSHCPSGNERNIWMFGVWCFGDLWVVADAGDNFQRVNTVICFKCLAVLSCAQLLSFNPEFFFSLLVHYIFNTVLYGVRWSGVKRWVTATLMHVFRFNVCFSEGSNGLEERELAVCILRGMTSLIGFASLCIWF